MWWFCNFLRRLWSLNLAEQNVVDFVDQPTSGSAASCNQGQEFQLQNLDKT